MIASACGQTSSGEARGGAGSMSAESAGVGAGGGLPSSGATASVAGNLGVPGGASLGGAGSGGLAAGGSGGAGPDDILAPLATDDATLDEASRAELIELGLAIGYAHGHALCTCIAPFPVSDVDLPDCARGEMGFSDRLLDPAVRQCVLEKASALPGFDDTLRCRVRSLRAAGRIYAECAQGPETRPLGPLADCSEEAAAVSLMNGAGCTRAFSCGDGELLDDARCDLSIDCGDGEDERGCGEVWCGDRLIERIEACIPESCDRFDPPLCETREGVASVICGDDELVTFDKLCDGAEDCASGRDEEYCF
jgi:hypothetical protein